MKRVKRIRASTSLLMVVFCFLIIMIFISSLISMTGTNVQAVGKYRNEVAAGMAAKAGLEESFYNLGSNASWTTGLDKTLGDSGARYRVTFNSSQKEIPYSTNNSTGSSAIKGYGGRVVPAGMIHLICLGSMSGASVTEQALLTVGGTLFEDDFDEGEDKWTRLEGKRFSVSKGRYYIGRKNGSVGEHRTVAGDESWTDYVIEANAQLLQDNGYGIYFRTTNEPKINAYVFQYDPGYYPYLGGSFIFRKVINGTEQDPFACMPRNYTVFAGSSSWWYEGPREIKVEVEGNKFSAYVDGVAVVTGYDSQLKHGKIGLRTWNLGYFFVDDIKVVGSGGSTGISVTSRW